MAIPHDRPKMDNKSAAPYQGQSVTPEDPRIVTETGARERMIPGEVRDNLWISPAERQEMGIGGAIPSSLAHNADVPGERVIVAVRDSSDPLYRGKEPNKFRRHQANYESIEAVNKGGEALGHADLIYATVSREEFIKHDQAHNEAAYAFTKAVIDGRVEGPEGLLEVFQQDTDSLQRLKDETHTFLRSQGIVEKRPAGMSYEDVVKFTGAERIVQKEREMARGGRTEKPGEYEDYAKRQKERRSGSRTYSFPGKPTSR